MIKSEDGKKCRGDFFWSIEDFSFEKDTIGHIFTGQYYGLHYRLITNFVYLDLKDYIKNLTQHS